MKARSRAKRLLAVLLAVALLLPTLAVCLPVTAGSADDYGVQTYDSMEAKQHGVSDGEVGIAGNGEGRLVSGDVDHTVGRAVKLKMAGYKETPYTPQTVALGADGTRLKLTKGKAYTVSAWLYSEAAVAVRYRLASVAQANNPVWGPYQNEKELTVELSAGQWKQVTVDVTPTGITGQETAYLTLGVTYADEDATATAYVYLDDVQVTDGTATAYGVQTYDSMEAKQHGVSDGEVGIAGNGEGRLVSGDVDHTVGRAVKLKMAGYKETPYTPQTVALGADGTRLKLTKGKAYTVSVWLYSEAAVAVRYRLASIAEPNNPVWGPYQNEKELTVELSAGQWKQVTVDVTPAGVTGQETAYLTLGVTYADEDATATAYVYLDDVQVKVKSEGDTPSAATNEQDYEALSAGTPVTLRGTGSVSAEQNHTSGGRQSAKVLMNNSAGVVRPQMALLNSLGQPMQVEVGKGYEVSMWVYVADEAASVPLNYWLCSSAAAEALTDKSQAEYDMGAGKLDLPTGSWQQLKIMVDSVKNGPYLIFGVTTVDANTVPRHIYIDDVQVTEKSVSVADNKQDYEKLSAGTSLTLRGTGIVSVDQNHTADGKQSARVVMNNSAGVVRPQMALLNSLGQPMQVEVGKGYEVSMWVYVADEAASVPLNYWLCSSAVAEALTDKSQAEYDMGAGKLDLPTGSWQQLKITVDSVKNGPYLILGITTRDASSLARHIYIDDVTVTELEADTAFTSGLQDYEGYEAKVHAASGDGIHGNGSGREVSTEQNHTSGGGKSIKLNVNNSLPEYYARTVLPLNGKDHAVKRGDSYTVSFWLYSEEAREITWYVGSVVSGINLYDGKNDVEKQGAVTLSAGRWTQVTANLSGIMGYYSSDTAYLTIGVVFEGCMSQPASIYLDDVELKAPEEPATVTFHTNGGGELASRKAFPGETLGYLPSITRDGYLFLGWYNADGTVQYTSATVLPAAADAVELYAKWAQLPAEPYSLATGFEEAEYTAIPYANDDPATAEARSNMTASATWMKDAGFKAETGDGAMRLVNDPFVQEASTAYQAFALMNADGTPFVVKAGAKYRITYSYRCEEVHSAHSYVGAFITADMAFDGVGTGDQQLKRKDIHGLQEEWARMEDCFVADVSGYVYLTLCARYSTSEQSSRYHAVYIDNVSVEVLDDTYTVLSLVADGSTYASSIGKEGAAITYPTVSVPDGKELEGYYTDAAFTQKFEPAVYPTEDTTLYARFVDGDYGTNTVYVQDSLTLDFEETFLPAYYSADNHMTADSGQIEFITDDADTAHSGSSYARVNSMVWNYAMSYLMLYDPQSTHNILYLEPNCSYKVSFYVRMEDDFAPFGATLCSGDVSGITDDILYSGVISQEIVAGEWCLVEGTVATGPQPAALSLRFDTYKFEVASPLILLDDVTVLKLHDVTVTFETNGGEEIKPLEVSIGYPLERLTDPYRMGYEFLGWYTDKDFKQAFDFETVIMEELTLYAKWKKIPTGSTNEEGDETDGAAKPGSDSTATPLAPVDVPTPDTGMDIGDRVTVDLTETAPADVPTDDPAEPTPEGAFSVQMVLIIIAIVVVLVGGGALTVFLLRRKKANGKEEV